MEKEMKQKMIEAIKNVHLPRYHQIPDVGLYLEQVVKFINESLSPLGIAECTSSMVSNYVKQKIIPSPIKKQYTREQIAHLMFIAVNKTVLSMENIKLLIEIQKLSYETEVAYNYFCLEFENVLYDAFGLSPKKENLGVTTSDEKDLLKNTITAIVYKIYLDKYLEVCRIDISKKNNKKEKGEHH